MPKILVSDILISRFSHIFMHFLRVNKSKAAESTGFLFMLLQHCSNLSVIELFKYIMTYPEYQITRFALKDSNLSCFLAKELSSSCDNDIINSLCRIISLSVGTRELSKSFTSSIICTALCDKIINEKCSSFYVWEAISSVCCEITYEKLHGLVNNAFSFLHDHCSSLTISIIPILDFFSKMIEIKPFDYDSFIFSPNIQYFFRLMVSFPDSSNLMSSFFRFLFSVIKHRPFLLHIIDNYVPMLVSESSSPNRSSASANSIQFLIKLKELSTHDEEISQKLLDHDIFLEFTQGYLIKYQYVVSNHYGGEVQRIFPSAFIHSF